ncbi:chemotaxis protein CheB [Parathalassolituus penaei]|uniref:protein-glutamate methylesterase n=1 Tax=Parathalassolituus penaei TaxID=2997323 RepID=A0A9X3IUN7_9GAMM|nr:chemotaxis protein CheB [Parathalassolituus penaei]MCY0966368.1 chemotaxis protein CheB [Parathalassolituus penaei]
MGLPRVGILADDRLQQHLLSTAVAHFGFEVVISADPQRMALLERQMPELDVWLVDINRDDDEDLPGWLDNMLDGDIPVLVGFEKAPHKGAEDYARWQKRLLQKLRELVPEQVTVAEYAAETITTLERSSQPNRHVIPLPKNFAELRLDGQVASQVWVLGASLGGPGAVKAFLDALPAGLPIAFVYAQHIDPRFENTLRSTIGRHSAYQMRNFEEGSRLLYGQVMVAPVTAEFVFDSRGCMHSLGTAWPGSYGPSIDQVMLNVHRYFGPHAGYILFSGMGNDGTDATITITATGVPVWVQTPSTCANSSMPESALETNKVTFHGDPFQLANQLVNRLKNTWVPL